MTKHLEINFSTQYFEREFPGVLPVDVRRGRHRVAGGVPREGREIVVGEIPHRLRGGQGLLLLQGPPASSSLFRPRAPPAAPVSPTGHLILDAVLVLVVVMMPVVMLVELLLLDVHFVPVDEKKDGEYSRQFTHHETAHGQDETVTVLVAEHWPLEGGLWAQLVTHFRLEGRNVDHHASEDQ
ncbi:hypothetical protein TNIN_309891 [Trichonephila inaurata madagascariensis]|uniref:Uncharacterized protein n=1 Tax=Trichonephila inaurata madagascariensis TaxID=2747483 RepID=A0A8X6YPB1_9ARAC|nr:hypothetical protein TNIN_309891 [Trichonephila inaurata madagascariensis]